MKPPRSSPIDATPRHPISVVVGRTGLSQHVLRIWERRYGAVEPSRGEGGHRVYSDADIARLRLLHAATRAGRTIGQLARLSTEELARIADEDAAAHALVPGADADRPNNRPHAAREVMEQALALTLSLDAPGLDSVLRRAAARVGMTDFLEHLVTPLLWRIGDEWHAGKLTIAQEHLASSTIYDILVESMRSLARADADRTLVVATLPGDRHAIGAALAATVAAAEGWNVLYLGADLPTGEIAAAALATGAHLVAVSVVYVEDRGRTIAELRILREQLPAVVPLLVGGGGAASLSADLAGVGIHVGTSLASLHEALRARSPTSGPTRRARYAVPAP